MLSATDMEITELRASLPNCLPDFSEFRSGIVEDKEMVDSLPPTSNVTVSKLENMEVKD